MCGRFNVSNTPGLQALLDALGSDLTLPSPAFNVAPTEAVQLLRKHDGEVSLDTARWWLTPHWSEGPSQKYAMFNARCEGLTQSAAFRKPFASQRGILPLSSFIEWRKQGATKQPWLISNTREALAVAALWDCWFDREQAEPLLSCTIVTTAAAERFRPWHARMPVMLTPDEQAQWLDNDVPVAADDPLFDARLKEPLHLVPIDRAVGNARHKERGLMAPTGETVTLQPECNGRVKS